MITKWKLINWYYYFQEEELDIPMPKSVDPNSIQKFFMDQVQIGEEKLGMGKK